MKMRPLHDRVLVKRFEEKQTVKGGIIIPGKTLPIRPDPFTSCLQETR